MKFFSLFPEIKDKSVGMKLLILILLVAVFLVLSTIFGIVIAIPIFGFEIFRDMTALDDLSSPRTIAILKYFQVVNQIGIFILPALFYAQLENRDVSGYLRLKGRININYLIISVFIIAASIPAINWLVEANEQMRLPEALSGVEQWMRESEDRAKALTDSFLNVNTVGGLVINLIIIALLAAVGEEFLFRGVILRIFNDWSQNVHLSVILSAILFSAIHFQFYGFFPRLFLGIMFGYIFLWTGAIWITVVLHFLFNGLTVVAYYLYNTGVIETDIDAIGTSANTIVLIGSVVSTVVLLTYLNQLTKKKINE
jgi:membrane protease YdiL (CAAX protease family)